MGESVTDDTYEYTAQLTENLTGLVKDIHSNVQDMNYKEATKNLKRFILQIGIRGIHTILGFRKTIGSQEIPCPSFKVLLENFNKPNQLLSVEEKQRIKSYSKLTVGGRAW